MGKWMDGDGAVVVIQDDCLEWPDGSACNLAVKGEALQLLGGGEEVCEGRLSSDGGWLVWSDGDTWVRMLPGAEEGKADVDVSDDDDSSDENEEKPNTVKQASVNKVPPQQSEEEDISTSDSEDEQSEGPVEAAGHAWEGLAEASPEERRQKAAAASAEEEERKRRQLEEEAEEEAYREEEERLLERWDAWNREQPGTSQQPSPVEHLPQEPGVLATVAEEPELEAREAPAEEEPELEITELEVRAPPAAPQAQPEAQPEAQPQAEPQVQCAELAVLPEEEAPSEEVAQSQAEAPEEPPEEPVEEEPPEEEPPMEPKKAPEPPPKPIDEPLTGHFPLERSVDDASKDALETPRTDLLSTIYTEPLKFKVRWKVVMLRKEPSTQAASVTTLALNENVLGYPQGRWLQVQKPKGWLLLDGSKLGLGVLAEPVQLQLRVQQTFSDGVLLEWDRLTGGRFVDYAVQWCDPDKPGDITTAASHLPRPCAKIMGLPSNTKLQLRLCACIYTETKSNGGERFSALVGPWCEVETVDEPTVDALFDPRPEKMQDIYTKPLDYKVRKEVAIRYSPSTKAKAYGVLPPGKALVGHQQGNWLFLSKPVHGWVLIDGEKKGAGLLLEHGYLEPTIVRAFAEAALVEWEPIPGPKFVDYSLQWSHGKDAPWTTSQENLSRPIGIVNGLQPDDRVLVRVCAHVYTQSKGNNGQLFAIVYGPTADVETESPITAIEEESLCLDPMANLRGRCIDTECRGFVGTQLDMDYKPKSAMDYTVVCRRCGHPAARHMIIGEFQYRKHGTQQVPSAFKLPTRLLHQAEKEAKEAEQEKKAITGGQPNSQAAPKPVGPLTWRPEDSGLDGDRVSFTLDKIAQARNLYETLGVPPDCDDKDIRHAHRRIALWIHPDKVQNRGDADVVKQAEAAFKIVSAAYEVLSDPLKRGSYTQSIKGTTGGTSVASTRKDLTAASLLRRFLSKAMWGWDLQTKPPGDWEEYGKGVYGKSKNINVTVIHAITKEEVKFTLDRGTTLHTLKVCIVNRVKRGPESALELATVEGDELQEDYRFSSSLSLICAGVSSFGAAKEVRLCLSHAHTGARHYVHVPDTSTIGEVKEAAAKSLKVRAIDLRLGYRSNNRDKLHDFEEKDLLNGRSQILILGVEIPIKLSVEEALELQQELLEAYSQISFQRELDELLAQHPPLDGLLDPDFKERWDYLLKHAQKNILMKHGFDGPHGAMTMMAAFHEVNGHEEVTKLGVAIDNKLRITMGTALPPVIAVLVQPADEDCDSDDEVQRGIKVVLLKGSKIGDLKEAVGKRLKEEPKKIEVVTMGKPELFSKKPRSCTVHPDEEAVGLRRLFQIKGIKMPPQEEIDRALNEQDAQRRQRAAVQAKSRRRDEELATWEALKNCNNCKKQSKAYRGHISKDDSKWYCNFCWAAHHRADGRHNAAHAILAADKLVENGENIDRETRKCTTPGCKYKMHRNMRLGAYIYCCVHCKEGIGHTFACERRDVNREDSPEPLPLESPSKPSEPAKAQAAPKAAAEPQKAAQPVQPSVKEAPKAVTITPAVLRQEEKRKEPPKPDPPKPAVQKTAEADVPVEVTVEVKSVNNPELSRTLNRLQANTTWMEVKRALAHSIGRPAVLQFGKLAQKGTDGFFCSLDDNKAVKESQEIYLMNCDLTYNNDIWDISEEDYRKAERKRQQPGVPAEKKPAPKEEKEATLTIKDLRSGTGFEMRVLKTMTALEVRSAVAWATSRTEEELMQGKLLKKGGDGYVSVTDEEIAGDKRSLWMHEVEMAPKRGSPADKMYLKKGTPVVAPQVEQERSAAAAQAAKEGDEEGWRLQLEDAKDPELVMVTITHATNKNDPAVEVVVMDNCCLSRVLEALADRTGRTDVLRAGGFVERKHAASYKKLRLEEPLKKRRELLILGVDLKPRR